MNGHATRGWGGGHHFREVHRPVAWARIGLIARADRSRMRGLSTRPPEAI